MHVVMSARLHAEASHEGMMNVLFHVEEEVFD
jgi:hypothetical protein